MAVGCGALIDGTGVDVLVGVGVPVGDWVGSHLVVGVLVNSTVAVLVGLGVLAVLGSAADPRKNSRQLNTQANAAIPPRPSNAILIIL